MNSSTALKPRQKASASLYREVSRRSEIEGASPHKLTELLLQGAIKNIHLTRDAIAKKDIVERGNYITKAMSIVAELEGTLDKDRGGELAENLSMLYQFLTTTLLDVHVSGDGSGLDQAEAVLENILEAWRAIKETT